MIDQMANYKELKARADALAASAEQARQAELQAVIDEVRMKVREYGISAREVFGYRGNSNQRKRAAVKPKYRDPVTGATWTGRGVAPRWIRCQNRDDFLIEL